MSLSSPVQRAPSLRSAPSPSVRPGPVRSHVARVILALATCWSGLLLWSVRDYVPIWDARIYAECVVEAATESLGRASYRCAEHLSHAYIGLLSLVQRWSPGSYGLMLAANVALLGLGAWALARTARALLPAAEYAPERTCLVALFLVHPLVLASAVHVNLDFGVLVFLLCAVCAAAERRPAAMVAAGLLMSFSKETGALLYAALLPAYALTYLVPRPLPPMLRNGLLGAALVASLVVTSLPLARLSGVAGVALGLGVLAWAWWATPAPERAPYGVGRWGATLLPLAIPTIVVGLYLALHALRPGATSWQRPTDVGILNMLLWVQFGPGSLNLTLQFLVLSFSWMVSVVLIADACEALRRWARGGPGRTPIGVDADAALFLLLATASSVYLITRLLTVALPRYIVAGVPLVLACAVLSLVRLRVPPTLRIAVLAGVGALFALSAVRTVDPVSKRVWGTFAVGRHDLLLINRFVPISWGVGRDENLYNLQFTAIADLIDLALHRTGSADGSTLVVNGEAAWYEIGPVGPDGRRRLGRDDGAGPTVLKAEDLVGGWVAPDSAWFLAFPYVYHAPVLQQLATHGYVVGAADTVSTGGYAMTLWPLRRAAPSARSAPPTRLDRVAR